MINKNQIPKGVWEKAFELTKNIDKNDTAFITLTEYTEEKLWALDKKLSNGLKNKGYLKIIGTKELKEKALKNNRNDEFIGN